MIAKWLQKLFVGILKKTLDEQKNHDTNFCLDIVFTNTNAFENGADSPKNRSSIALFTKME